MSDDSVQIVGIVKKTAREEEEIICLDEEDSSMGKVLSATKQGKRTEEEKQEEEEEWVFGVDERKKDGGGVASSGKTGPEPAVRDDAVVHVSSDDGDPHEGDSPTSTVDLDDTHVTMKDVEEVQDEGSGKDVMVGDNRDSRAGKEKSVGEQNSAAEKGAESAGLAGDEAPTQGTLKRRSNVLDEVGEKDPETKRPKTAAPMEKETTTPTPEKKDTPPVARNPDAEKQAETEPKSSPDKNTGATEKNATEKTDEESPRAVTDRVGNTGDEDANLSDLEIVQRKWQTASIAHFFAVCKNFLPVENALGEGVTFDTSARTIERAIAVPDTNPALPQALRDIFAVLLLALKRVSIKRAKTHWYETLCTLAAVRRAEFTDTDGAMGIRQWKDGIRFLVEAPWPLRLAALSACVDLVAETDVMRDCISVREDSGRLQPFGRDSKRKWYYRVGSARIYSGFKRKGNGFLAVECSDADSMKEFVERLKGSDNMRDKALAGRVEDLFLPDVVKEEEEAKRRQRKMRELQLLRRNDLPKERLRPRRRRVVYTL